MAQLRNRLAAIPRGPWIWAIGILIGVGAGAAAAIGLAERSPVVAHVAAHDQLR